MFFHLRQDIVSVDVIESFNMYKLIVFVAIIATATALQNTPIKKCKNYEAQVSKNVVVHTSKGICTSLPCVVSRGTNITTYITFDVKSEVDVLTMKVNATVAGTVVNYPIANADKACDWLTNTFCPIEKGSEAEMEFFMPVLNIFPKIHTLLALYLVDQTRKVVSCFEVDIQVV